tara:strand:+ start:554 stop:1351 length:798 start_codon:yes stop_codon:yes gene_type:complete
MTHKKSKHINVDEISLAKPQFYSKTGASVGLFYLNKLLEIQTPKLMCRFGINCYKEEEKSEKIKSITIALQFASDVDKTNRVDNFQKMIKRLDKKVKEEGFKSHKVWLKINKPPPKDVMKALYKETLYYKRLPTTEIDYSVPPTFKVKVPYYNNKLGELTILDENNNPIEYDLDFLKEKIVDGAILKAIVQPKVYIMDKNFGITYNLKALQFYGKSSKKKNKKEKNKSINSYFGKQEEVENDSSNDSDSDNNDLDNDSDNDSFDF